MVHITVCATKRPFLKFMPKIMIIMKKKRKKCSPVEFIKIIIEVNMSEE
jgi:hypothetical protein